MLLMYLYHDTEGGSVGTVEVGPSESSCQWFLFIQCTQVEQCISVLQGNNRRYYIYIYVKSLQTRREREIEEIGPCSCGGY